MNVRGGGKAIGSLAAIFILLVCARHYYDRTIALNLPRLTDAPTDFLPYHQAARNILHGKSPYLADGYIYPPVFAFLLTPLARLDYVTARHVWFAACQLFLLLAAFLLWRAAGGGLAAASWIAFVWAFGDAAEEALALGQISPLLTLLIVFAITCPGWIRGASVGWGFALKLFPGLLGVAVLLRGKKRAIAWMLASALIAILLPWAAVAAFLKGPATTHGAWTGTPSPYSWSLPSVALRVADPAHQVHSLPREWTDGTVIEHLRLPFRWNAISVSVSVLTLGLGLWALTRTVRGTLAAAQAPWAMAALVALALAASPICWTHYQVMEYPGVALLLIFLWRQERWGQLAAAVALASLLYPVPHRMLEAATSIPSLYLWTSVTPLAMLGLFALFLRQAREVGAP